MKTSLSKKAMANKGFLNYEQFFTFFKLLEEKSVTTNMVKVGNEIKFKAIYMLK